VPGALAWLVNPLDSLSLMPGTASRHRFLLPFDESMKTLRVMLVLSMLANLYFIVRGVDRGSVLGDCLDEQQRQHRRSILAADAASAGWRSRSVEEVIAYARDLAERRKLLLEVRGDVVHVEDLAFRLTQGRVQAVYLFGDEAGGDAPGPGGKSASRP
jgi:hypothetical protein